MVIDFHTHTFPDSIAAGAIESLQENSDTFGYTDGTNDGLMKSMERGGIDYSVIMPVVTNPVKTSHINQAAAEINKTSFETGLISFGGIHPDAENYKELLDECVALGLKGIKLHPDYYGGDFNDIRTKRIIDYASELGLIILTHAGLDIGLYPPIRCSIDHILEVMREVNPDKMVLAHMGGWMNWYKVMDKLAGEHVWLDTAFCLGEINWRDKSSHRPFHMMTEEQFIEMVGAFGADKILFATDSPWADQKDYVDRIRRMSLSESDKDKILFQNAKKLLNVLPRDGK